MSSELGPVRLGPDMLGLIRLGPGFRGDKSGGGKPGRGEAIGGLIWPE